MDLEAILERYSYPSEIDDDSSHRFVKGADMKLLPDNTDDPNEGDLTIWQMCVKESIIETQLRAVPYLHDKRYPHAGSTRDTWYPMDIVDGDRLTNSKRILRSLRTNNKLTPRSHCVGANMEVFLNAWAKWLDGADAGWDMTAKQAWELRGHFFAYVTDDNRYWRGARGGLIWLAGEKNWLKVEDNSMDNLDISKLKFGDVFSMQNTKDPMASGHSTIFIKNVKHPTLNKDVAIVWSAAPSYERKWITARQASGNGFDWYTYDRRFKSGWIRKIHSAGIRNAGYPGEPDE